MNWLEHVSEGGFLRSVFQGRAPILDPVDLHEVRFERDGAISTLRFDLSEFPETLPKAWIGRGYTVVQVQLMAIGITSCQITGWTTTMSGPMRIERRDGLAVEFESEGSRFSIGAEHLRIHAVSAYARALG